MSRVEMNDKPKVRTCLWFNDNGAEAAEFYVSLLPDSAIEVASGPVVELRLAGTPYMFLNGGLWNASLGWAR